MPPKLFLAVLLPCVVTSHSVFLNWFSSLHIALSIFLCWILALVYSTLLQVLGSSLNFKPILQSVCHTLKFCVIFKYDQYMLALLHPKYWTKNRSLWNPTWDLWVWHRSILVTLSLWLFNQLCDHLMVILSSLLFPSLLMRILFGSVIKSLNKIWIYLVYFTPLIHYTHYPCQKRIKLIWHDLFLTKSHCPYALSHAGF